MNKVHKSLIAILFLFVFLPTLVFASTSQTVVWDENGQYNVNLGVGVFSGVEFSGGTLKIPSSHRNVQAVSPFNVVDHTGQLFSGRWDYTFRHIIWATPIDVNIKDLADTVFPYGYGIKGSLYVLRNNGTVYRLPAEAFPSSTKEEISGISDAEAIFVVRDSSFDYIYYLTKTKRIKLCSMPSTGNICTEQTIANLPNQDFIKISGSQTHVLALTTDGKVYGWIHPIAGMTASFSSFPPSVYLGSSCTTTTPNQACLIRSGVTDIAAGYVTSYMLEGGKVYGMSIISRGSDSSAIASNATCGTDYSPISGYVKDYNKVELTNVIKIGSKADSIRGVAITSSGQLYQWGGSSLGCEVFAKLRRTGLPSDTIITKSTGFIGSVNYPLIVTPTETFESTGTPFSIPSGRGHAIYELNYTPGTIFTSIVPVASEGVRYAVSKDGISWFRWNNSYWDQISFFERIYNDGMTSISQLTGYEWNLIQSGTTKLYIAVALVDPTKTVSSIKITKVKPIEILRLVCPSSHTIGHPASSYLSTIRLSCSADIYTDSSITTGVSHQWNISSGFLDGTNINGNRYSANFFPKLIGRTSKTETVTFRVCGNAPNTNICDVKTANVLIQPPIHDLSASTLSCPSTISALTNGQCTANASFYSCQNGTCDYSTSHSFAIPVTYTWTSLSSGLTVSPANPNNISLRDNATIRSTTMGVKNLKVKIAFRDAPDFFTEKTVSIEFTSPPITVTSISCTPSSAYLGQQISCSGVVDNPGGHTLSNIWTIRNVDNSIGGTIISTGGTALSPTATLKATTTQQSKIVRLRSCDANDMNNCGERAFTITILNNNINATLTGDTKLLYNEEGHVHIASATRTWGTLQYSWSVSSGTTKTDIPPIAPNVSSVKVKSTVPTAIVTARISLVEDPTFFITRDHVIEVVVPELSILSFSCPQDIDYSQTQQVACSVNVHAKSTTNKAIFTWTGNNVTFSGQTNTDNSSQVNVAFQSGALSASVVVKACLSDVPTMCRSQNATVRINYPKPVINDIVCPNPFYITKEEECNVNVSTPWGTPKNTWTSSGTITQIDNNKSIVVFNNPPINNIGTVTVTSCLSEVPSVCSSKTKNIFIKTPLITISSVNCPETLTKRVEGECTATATINDDFPLSYSWHTSSDGVISSNGNVASIKYNSAGRKSISVTAFVTNIPGIRSSMSRNINVTGIVSPALEVSGNKTVKKGQPLKLTAKGTSPYGNVNLSWIVEGNEYETDTLEYTFLSAGIRHVTLKGVINGYEDDPDAESVLNIRITVNDVRKPHISSILGLQRGGIAKAEVGVPYSLKASASGEFPTVIKWELSNGTSAVGEDFTFTSFTVGTLKGKATVAYKDFANIPELTSSVEFTVYVRNYELIVPDLKLLTPATGVAPYYVAVIPKGNFAEMYSFQDNTLTFKWDFGDGTIKETSKPIVVDHLYITPGSYTLELTLKDSRGNQKVVSENIEVMEPPPLVIDDFKIVKSNKYSREPLLVVVRPLISGGHPKSDRITEYKWYLDGEEVEGSTRVKSFVLPSAGSYTISLEAISATGKKASKSVIIDVFPNKPPICDFTYVNYRLAKATKITPSCVDSDGTIQSYQWDLGNGETSIRTSPYVMYKTPGNYNVKLTAVDSSGAEVVVEKTIVVDY